MGIVGGKVGYRLLRYLLRVSPGNELTTAYDGRSKMEQLFGPDIWNELADKTVVDFGCATGMESVEIAQHTNARIIGLDIREDALAKARQRANDAGVCDRVFQVFLFVEFRERFRRIQIKERSFGFVERELVGAIAKLAQHRVTERLFAAISLRRRHREYIYVGEDAVRDCAHRDCDSKWTEFAERISNDRRRNNPKHNESETVGQPR